MEERALSAVGGNSFLLFLMPARARGGWRTPAVAEAEAKKEVGANCEEVK